MHNILVDEEFGYRYWLWISPIDNIAEINTHFNWVVNDPKFFCEHPEKHFYGTWIELESTKYHQLLENHHHTFLNRCIFYNLRLFLFFSYCQIT